MQKVFCACQFVSEFHISFRSEILNEQNILAAHLKLRHSIDNKADFKQEQHQRCVCDKISLTMSYDCLDKYIG